MLRRRVCRLRTEEHIMKSPFPVDVTTLLWIALRLIVFAMLLALTLLVVVINRIRRIQLAPNADFISALRATPLVLAENITRLHKYYQRLSRNCISGSI